MRDVVIVADLGPNPASLSELIWGLVSQHQQRVEAVFLLTNSRSRRWLEIEFFSEAGALAQLRSVLGDAVPPPDRIQIRAVTAAGRPLEEDHSEGDAAAWNAARWELSQEAIQAAGERSVVFGLLGGRRRTQTALTTVMFQLLARDQDRCLDVRVSDRRAEGGTGFFFPQQRCRWLHLEDGSVLDATQISVLLVEVELPRLRGLLPPSARSDWQGALDATQNTLQKLHRPVVVVDLCRGAATVNGLPLPLSHSQLIWFAVLAVARMKGEGWVASSDAHPITTLLGRVQNTPWFYRVRNRALRQLMAVSQAAEEDLLRVLRSQTRSRVLRAVSEISNGILVVPEHRAMWVEGGKQTAQRLPLEAERVTVVFP